MIFEPSGAFAQVIVFNGLREIDTAVAPLGLHQGFSSVPGTTDYFQIADDTPGTQKRQALNPNDDFKTLGRLWLLIAVSWLQIRAMPVFPTLSQAMARN
jgi:hypothetical protein